jgi:hypothetical protein
MMTTLFTHDPSGPHTTSLSPDEVEQHVKMGWAVPSLTWQEKQVALNPSQIIYWHHSDDEDESGELRDVAEATVSPAKALGNVDGAPLLTAAMTREEWREIFELLERGCDIVDNYEPSHKLHNLLGGELWR